MHVQIFCGFKTDDHLLKQPASDIAAFSLCSSVLRLLFPVIIWNLGFCGDWSVNAFIFLCNTKPFIVYFIVLKQHRTDYLFTETFFSLTMTSLKCSRLLVFGIYAVSEVEHTWTDRLCFPAANVHTHTCTFRIKEIAYI